MPKPVVGDACLHRSSRARPVYGAVILQPLREERWRDSAGGGVREARRSYHSEARRTPPEYKERWSLFLG